MCLSVVQKPNVFLQSYLGGSYVVLRRSHASHFLKKNANYLAHVNFFGKTLRLALQLRVVGTRFHDN